MDTDFLPSHVNLVIAYLEGRLYEQLKNKLVTTLKKTSIKFTYLSSSQQKRATMNFHS